LINERYSNFSIAEEKIMYDSLKGKTALITGSGKRTGIGYQIANILASNGCNIIIADMGKNVTESGGVTTGTHDEMEDIAKGLKEEYGINTLAVDVDVTSPASINQMLEKIKKHFEHIEILCNNAGATFGANLIQFYDENAWVKTVDVNLHGTFRVSQAIIPLMLGKAGSIINISSKAGKEPPPLGNGAYAAAKAGVIMFTKVLARELGGAGIRVNAICPGQIDTEMRRWGYDVEASVLDISCEERIQQVCTTIPLGRIGDPDEVAKLVAFLASEESSYITGQAINVCGGQMLAY
jgi:NAD(P)-dependent dehydrogenase (short-subunit alcohol dehydrogenase family)